jgi:hypothetical protein
MGAGGRWGLTRERKDDATMFDNGEDGEGNDTTLLTQDNGCRGSK